MTELPRRSPSQAEEETLEAAAIRKMREFVGKPLFSEEELVTKHRQGLKDCYLEAARLEFGALASLSPEEVALSRRIEGLAAFEAACSSLCRDVEATIFRIGAMGTAREAAVKNAAEVKEACDALLASQQEYRSQADALAEALEDVRVPDDSVIEDCLRREDFDEAGRVMADVADREKRLATREESAAAVFRDEDRVAQEFRATRRAWAGKILDALSRWLRQRASTDDWLFERSAVLGGFQRLLREHEPQLADDAQRVYARLRLVESGEWPPRGSDLDEACKRERRVHATVFGDAEDAALDDALHAACEERLHATGRATVVHAQLAEVKIAATAARETSQDETKDDAVRAAAAKLWVDAQERAIFLASTHLREDVEGASPTTSDLERAAASPDALYRPVARTLELLDAVHGCVRPKVFDDFAQHALAVCVETLTKLPPFAHGDLFAVKHLLALRDRVVPYGISYGALVKRKLDWATPQPKQHHIAPAAAKQQPAWRRLFRLPTVAESTVDARRDLERQLKKHCANFVARVHRDLVHDLDTFLDAIQAECPKDCDLDDAPPALVSRLRGLDVAQPADIGRRLRAALDHAQAALQHTNLALATFLDNSTTRALLLKPARTRANNTLADFKAAAALLLAPDILAELQPHFAAFAALLDQPDDA